MSWLNEPACVVGATATCSPCAREPGTDFWRTTHYGFIRDYGHFADTG